MNKSISGIVIWIGTFMLVSAQDAEQSATQVLQLEVANNGLYFDGQKRTNSDLNTNDSGFDFFFGRRITPHGDCIKQFGDYVFMTWWAGGEENQHVMLSRYNLKTEVLETIEFPHTHVGFRSIYPHIGDSHNTIAVGISPLDSTVHMLYDMHSYSKNDFPDTYFNYSISFEGAATAPDGSFNLALFKPKQTHLNSAYNYSDITYPKFFLNDQDELFVWFREGGNNNGSYKFAKYQASVWGAFTDFNVLGAKAKGNAYNWGLYGDLEYVNGKLRAGFAVRTADNNDKYTYNNGFYYAYSNDPDGATQWFNYKNESLVTPIVNPAPLFIYEQGDEVTNGGANSVYITSGANWTVTDNESVHFIGNNIRSTVDNTKANVHAFKKAGDSDFTISTDFPGGNLHPVAGDRTLLIGLNSSGRPYIYITEGGTNNWELLHQATSGLSYRHMNVLVNETQIFMYLMEKGSGDSQPMHLQVYDLELPTVAKVISAQVWNWETAGDLEGWIPENGDTDATVSDGILTMTWSNHNTPKLVKNALSLSTADYRKVLVRMKITPNIDIITGGASGTSCRIVTTTSGAASKFFAFDHSSGDEEFKTYIINVGADPAKYSGTLTGVQFQALRNSQGGNSVEITEFRLIAAPNTWTGAVSADWNVAGNWSENRIPTGEEITIPMVANQPIITGLEVDVAELDLQDGVVLSVTEKATLTVLRDLKVTGSGHVQVESGSSLVTYGVVEGSDHVFNRNTTFDNTTGQYSVIGSLVEDASTTSLGSLVYSYDETLAYGSERFVEVLSPESMAVGNAYFSAYTGDISFTGTPNTGDVKVQLAYNSADGTNAGFNLVSNPYPAAIDFEKLVTSNQGINGTIYLWDDGGSDGGRRDDADYITVNMIGEVATANNGSKRSSDWNGYIGSAQGFFVRASGASAELNFNNEMKVDGKNESASYFRKSQNEHNIQSLKISLSNKIGATNESLIGFLDDATEGYDRLYDAYKIDGTNGIRIYSLLDEIPMSIQGFPIVDELTIPLGIDLEKAGNYTLNLDFTTNWKEGKNIYLHDVNLDQFINLGAEKGYTFSSGSVKENRFELIISSGVLSATEVALKELDISYNQKELIISGISPQELSLQVSIMDMSGALLLNEQLGELKETMRIDFPFDSNRVYVLKVSNNSKSSVSKVLFR